MQNLEGNFNGLDLLDPYAIAWKPSKLVFGFLAGSIKIQFPLVHGMFVKFRKPS
jgi:hypothetical protein